MIGNNAVAAAVAAVAAAAATDAIVALSLLRCGQVLGKSVPCKIQANTKSTRENILSSRGKSS